MMKVYAEGSGGSDAYTRNEIRRAREAGIPGREAGRLVRTNARSNGRGRRTNRNNYVNRLNRRYGTNL